MANELTQTGSHNIVLQDVQKSRVRIKQTLVNKQSSPFPFKLIRKARLFGRSDEREAFAPTEKEYLEGLVHRASLANEVEKRLTDCGWAWVRGRGAAGKTVLAIHLALGYEAKSRLAYYLNLAQTEAVVTEALDTLTTYADEQALFIIDNVHLNEGFARDIFDYWQERSMGSRLFLLGRDITVTDVRGTANPLDDLQVNALTLTVNSDDLAGVYHRLARRFHSLHSACPPPPVAVLQKWLAIFGGDLIAFSAAVALRVRQLTQCNWRLQPQDAADYVRETYLKGASESERINLLRLAVLAELEVDAPAEAIDRNGIEALLQGGLVHRINRGSDGRYKYYHLIHPGLGDLLLTATDYPSEELKRFGSDQRNFVAQRNPFTGQQIARRLESANRTQDAVAVLQSMMGSDQWDIAALLTAGIQYSHFSCERLVRLGVLSQSQIDQQLANKPLVLSEVALHTPLHFLVTFLDYAERKSPSVFAALRTELAQPQNLSTLTQAALCTPLAQLAFFVNYTKRKLPAVSESLNSKLAEAGSIRILATTACREPLDHFLKFVRSAGVAPDVVAAIDQNEWDQSRLADRTEQPHFVHGLSKELQRMGRPELAEAPARALINAAEPQHWHVPEIGLTQLSQVLRLGKKAGSEAILRFLNLVATIAWLEQQYKEESPGAIAASLFGLWGSYEQSVLDHFRLKSLTARLAAETKHLDRLTPEHLSAAIQLLGSSALMGVPLDKSQVKWPRTQQVCDAIRFAAPRAEMTTIGYIQIQLWLGLHQMASLRSDRVIVPAVAGEQILRLWKHSTGHNDKQQTLNTWMIDWLEQCARSSWVLVPDRLYPRPGV